MNFIIYSLFFIQIFIYEYDKWEILSEIQQGLRSFFSYNFGIFFVLIISKLIIIPFLFIEDISRLFYFLFNKVFKKKKTNLSRRKFVSKTALALSAIPIPIMLHGIVRGRYNFKVIKHTLTFKDLPNEFNGYKLTHVSDFHCGSLENRKKIEYGIDLINQQKSDLILFTGDFVNNTFKEIEPWKGHFSKLKAKDGKFSVLGNHDYGDYYDWGSQDEKEKNFNQLKEIQKKMGFNLLLDESVFIKKNNQKIALIGVENWGDGFKKKGDIDKAIKKINKDDFKILMSHDPSHWEKIIVNHNNHFDLTLSGHTHGMQFGIEIPGFIKWSPVKYRYKYWAGLYSAKNQYINVNRGFGVLGFPGRVGIWPEISVIELKKG